ncbi:hypothetical protein CSOJ01_13853 [Colletotrichum sojae]|uniref:Uncharacterized protein n=1 Tax=Colletotrichum sojae TaxID=2175907 RepID=A0A8H6IRD5_9PEZI|nr:hypothetical protein CSOJ01_13853 [Colletotrichum sojae]
MLGWFKSTGTTGARRDLVGPWSLGEKTEKSEDGLKWDRADSERERDAMRCNAAREKMRLCTTERRERGVEGLEGLISNGDERRRTDVEGDEVLRMV